MLFDLLVHICIYPELFILTHDDSGDGNLLLMISCIYSIQTPRGPFIWDRSGAEAFEQMFKRLYAVPYSCMENIVAD
jgi:hypothetical protein